AAAVVGGRRRSSPRTGIDVPTSGYKPRGGGHVMTMKRHTPGREPGAHQGGSSSNSILPAWARGGQASFPDSITASPSMDFGGVNPVNMTDQAASEACFTKQTFVRHLALSVRSLDRAAAAGLLPAPDLLVGRSPRWSPETVAKWLRSKPRLPG